VVGSPVFENVNVRSVGRRRRPTASGVRVFFCGANDVGPVSYGTR
jgi:hypothetical protein